MVFVFGCKKIDFEIPKVMGVINMTQDSFYDGGKIKDDRTLLSQAEKMLAEGADFLDVGGYSSRPGADFVSVEEERWRTIPAVKLILNGALFGTVAANTAALLNGADILRVHDVRPARDAIAVVKQLKSVK